MCKVIAVAMQKGGCAKTSVSLNLGIGLVRAGKKVLLIDNDPQGNLTASLGYEEHDDIASNWYPASLVKDKFMKLNYHHIQYVLDMLRSNTTKVRNIKKYILASLFNAPTTIESYYRAEVNHDFPQYAAAK